MWVAEGFDEDLFWKSTAAELSEVLDRVTERREQEERQAARRAGLVASAIYNVHRKKGKRPLGPDDFVEGGQGRMSPEEFRQRMHAWATTVNDAQEH